MPRVRWMVPVPVLCVVLVHALLGIDIVTADCWYDNEKHGEGTEVATAEPCLNCTCSRGALLCYLRVCPRLPNPPPPGCIILHRYRSCCPELICTDVLSGNGIEARSEVDPLEFEQENLNMGNACIANGSIYGPGSAMDSSTDCEYCYCLGGEQRCVQPKCLLPLEGCVPAYDSNDCCPVHYNCTSSLFTSTTTTTSAPNEYESKGGCVIDNNFYPEGGKVLGVGHSICDNCYCLRGLVRCEPLSCAPPLLGCSPVIREGECCAASYNCSGMIETQPEPYYGQLPIVSKEYAKLRKEAHHKPVPSSHTQQPNKGVSGHTMVPYYVIAETTKPRNQATTRQYTYPGLITQSPFYYNITSNNSSHNNGTLRRNESLPEIYYVVTKVTGGSRPQETELLNYDMDSLATTVRHKKYTSSVLPPVEVDSLEGRINRRIVQNTTEVSEATSTEQPTTTDITTTDLTTEEITSTQSTLDQSTELTFTEAMTTEFVTDPPSITMKTVLNTTDCRTNQTDDSGRDGIEDIGTETTSTQEVTEEPTTVSDVTVIDLEAKVKIATVHPKINQKIEALVNITKSKDHDYDYDYNAPTLPPSLPNLRIIPFVAADALESKAPVKNAYAEDRISEEYPFKNLFSPPIETEGGFVPKEPPRLDSFYDNNYHTTNVGAEGVTSLSVPAITNPPKNDENNCIVDGKEVTHGESVTSEGTCAICVCFYGSIVCHEPQCPIPRAGCRNSNKIDRSTCCPHLICDDEESPTVVLDRADVTSKPQDSITVADGVVVSPDPFRDVIRTEPAPDLKLLIGDMSNYLLKQSTTPPTTTTKEDTQRPSNNKTGDLLTDDDVLTLDKIWQFLISDEQSEASKPQTKPTTSTTSTTTDHPNLEIRTANHNQMETRENINDNLVRQPSDHGAVGLLKLAGCNIYGRMYRVGRIISELSGPCLECKCTEMGVQCETLKC